MIEKYLLLASYKNNIDVRILRIANPYGPGQNIYGRQGFIAMAIGKILNGLPLTLSNNGKVIRDFIYIDDVAEILSLCGTLDNLPPVINVGSQAGHSLKEVVNTISELLKFEVLTESTKSRNFDIPSSILNIDLMKEATLFSPTISLVDGLSRTLLHHGLDVSQSGPVDKK
jgi:UDP-glucose 4-epimerase